MKKIHGKKLALEMQSIRPLVQSELDRVTGGFIQSLRCESLRCASAGCVTFNCETTNCEFKTG